MEDCFGRGRLNAQAVVFLGQYCAWIACSESGAHNGVRDGVIARGAGIEYSVVFDFNRALPAMIETWHR
jgi:hypothetical protein